MHYASGVVKIQVSSGAPITLRLKATDDVEARVRAKLCERGFVPASSQIQPTSTVAGDADAGEASSNLLGGSDAPLQSKRARKSIEKYSPSKDWNEHDKRDSHRRSVDKPTTDICSYEQLQADFERLKNGSRGYVILKEEVVLNVNSLIRKIDISFQTKLPRRARTSTSSTASFDAKTIHLLLPDVWENLNDFL